MNKKLLAGFSMLVTVGAFWACGDGTINKMDVADELMATQYNSGDPEKDLENSKALKDKALKDCENDPICKAEYADYLANPDAPPPTSSEGSTTPTSASSNSGGGTPVSSSSHTIVAASSASETGPGNLDVSSSSEAGQPVTGLGSCAPAKTPISKGESVAWVFKPNGMQTTLDFSQGKGSLVWTVDPAGTETAAASGLNSPTLTFAKANEYKASVVATVGLNSEPIQCSPLRVNGTPITGCKCDLDPSSAVIDISGASKTATWTVSGCAPATETFTYTWTGATGDGATATYSDFKAANETHAPTVKVKSSESELDVTCPAPQVTDSNNPETNITMSYSTDPNSGTKTKLEAGSTYNITFSDNRGSLVCFGTGTLTCGSTDPKEINQYGINVGSYTDCAVVTVSDGASAECVNAW